MQKKSLLVIAPNSIELARNKGVEHQLLDFTCGDYFDEVVFLHFNIQHPENVQIADNIFVYELRKIMYFSPLSLISYLLNLKYIIRKHKVNLIRATDPFYRGLLGLFVSKIFNIPFCVSIHSDYLKRFELDGKRGMPLPLNSVFLSKSLQKFVLRNSTLILPIRASLQEYLEKFDVKRNRIHTIPHGLDLADFKTSQGSAANLYKEFNLRKSTKIISFVGRLSKENYVHDIIDIARELKNQERLDWTMILAGDGLERETLYQKIISMGLTRQVKLIGFINRELMVTLRKNSYINLALMGGFSLIEACASGRPVISYDVEWHRELISDRETGYLIDEGDTLAVSKIIQELFLDPDLANKIGQNGQKTVMKKHSLSAANTHKIEAYEKVYKTHEK